MPGGDGTGPGGLGPMTGRAAGFCAGYPVPGYMNPIGGRLGLGWGRGRGFGRGLGRGFGRGFGRGLGGYPMYGGYPYSGAPYAGAGYAPPYAGTPYAGAGYGAPYGGATYGAPYAGAGYAYAPEITPQQEADMLKNEAKAIQEELKNINSRIAELESAAKKK